MRSFHDLHTVKQLRDALKTLKWPSRLTWHIRTDPLRIMVADEGGRWQMCIFDPEPPDEQGEPINGQS